MKRQFIYSVNAQELRALVPLGFSLTSSFENIVKDEFTYIAQREQLEINPNYWQLLPYITITRDGKDGSKEIFVYQRTKKVGETRLSGAFSVGVGGHIDLADTQYHTHKYNSDVDVEATVLHSMLRELNEELVFTRQSITKEGVTEVLTLETFQRRLFLTGKFYEEFIHFNNVGTIRDNTDTVGLHHLGLVANLHLPSYIDVHTKEEELTTIGFLPANSQTLKDTLEQYHENATIESWSTLVLENL